MSPGRLRLPASALLLMALTGCIGGSDASPSPTYPPEHGDNITDARTCEILGFGSIDGLSEKFGYETAWKDYIQHCGKAIKPTEATPGRTVEFAATAWEFRNADAARATYAYNLAQNQGHSFIRSMKNSSMFQISSGWDEGVIAVGMDRADKQSLKMAARTGKILVHYSISIFGKGDAEHCEGVDGCDGALDAEILRKWLAESVSREAPAQLRAAFPRGAGSAGGGAADDARTP